MLRYEKRMDTVAPKTCKKCGLTDFYRSGQCRPCTVERQNEYYARNLPMRLANTQRARITGAYKSQGLCVPRKVFTLLGCTALALVAHIEGQFVEGMSWSNYPTAWEVDHINPLSQHKLADPQQAALACSFRNLRPACCVLVDHMRTLRSTLHMSDVPTMGRLLKKILTKFKIEDR